MYRIESYLEGKRMSTGFGVCLFGRRYFIYWNRLTCTLGFGYDS